MSELREGFCASTRIGQLVLMNIAPMLTNQFIGAWTHYIDTVRGTRTDHMVGSFQRISIE